MISASRYPSPLTLSLLVAVSVSVGALTVIVPAAGAAIPVAFVVGLGLLRMRHPILAVFLAFLVLQYPLILLAGGETTPSGSVLKVLDEAGLLAFAGWTILQNPATRDALRTKGIGWLIAGCFGGMILSSLLARTVLIPSLIDIILFSKPFLLFIVGTGISTRPGDVRSTLRIFLPPMLAAVVFAAVFLAFPSFQEAYVGPLGVLHERFGMLSAQGFFEGPGVYSWFCAATFAVSYAAYLSFGRTRYLWCAVVGAVFTLLSWRRKSIAGVIAMVVVAAVLHSQNTPHRRRRTVAILALVVIIGATVLAPLISYLWSYTISEYGRDPGSVARYALHHTSVLIAIDHFPLGAGLASFGSYASAAYYSDVYREYGLSTVWGLSPEFPNFIMDTFWPMVLGEGGVITLVPYAIFFLLLLRCCGTAVRRIDNADEDRVLALTGLFLLVGSLFEATSSHIYDSTLQSALVMIPAGVAWAHFGRATPTVNPRQRVMPGPFVHTGNLLS